MSEVRFWDGTDWDLTLTKPRAWDGNVWIDGNRLMGWNGDEWLELWPGAPPSTTFTYLAQWAQSYSGTTLNTSSHRDQLNYQGESSTHGEESSLWGFDDAQIRADLAGREISLVEARLTSRWTYAGSGKRFHIMEHNHSDKPQTVTLGDIIADIFLPRAGTGSVTLPVAFGERLRDGTARGIGLRYQMPGEEEWGYCTGMYSTANPVASPGDGDIITCPPEQLTMLTITTI